MTDNIIIRPNRKLKSAYKTNNKQGDFFLAELTYVDRSRFQLFTLSSNTFHFEIIAQHEAQKHLSTYVHYELFIILNARKNGPSLITHFYSCTPKKKETTRITIMTDR